MKVHCSECGAPIPASDINLDRMIAKCTSCDAVFSIEAAIEARKSQPKKVPLPEGVRVLRDGVDDFHSGGYRDDASPQVSGTLTIERRWYAAHLWFLLFFCVFWDGFLVVWYGVVFASGTFGMAAFFPLLHVAVGVGLTYWVIAGFMNTTTIRVDASTLSITHAPLPWRGARRLESTEVAQLFVKEGMRRTTNGHTQQLWELHAVLRDDRHLKLIGQLENRQQALYLENAIEEHLHIEDDRAFDA